jgi:DNA-3-methyladenine glycosylase I
MPEKCRCPWPGKDPLYLDYHDREWGVPVRDDSELYELLVLESAQAGLSWITILRRREGYRRAFEGFDPRVVALYGEARVSSLLEDAGIIRNRKKIESAVSNARAFLRVQEAFGSFSAYLWGFVGGKSIVNEWKDMAEVPARTDLSESISRDMKSRGFTFFGPVACYAFLQSAGIVNDHLVSCFRHREVQFL